MKISKFVIYNFKGIKKTTIHVQDETPGNVVTLIGLNESGKTTILEAISQFITEDKNTAELVGTVAKKVSLQDLIPKDRKAAFTGHVRVVATAKLDDTDVRDLSAFMLTTHKLVLNESSISRECEAGPDFEFVDSNLKVTLNMWSIKFDLKAKKAVNFKSYHGGKSNTAAELVIWRSGVASLRDKMPKIVYFPTFLFDFPDRIYLQNYETELNSYYTQVLQDVLECQGEGLNIQKHIIDRVDNAKIAHPAQATFLANFFQRDERKQIDAVLQKAANEMSRVIFGSWNQILGRNVTGKRVQIDWLFDGEKENAFYIELSIVDGQSKYSLSERSLGFRWFFSFLLFTEFRRNRKRGNSTLFLFDEPAANLHSKAQIKLLESFARIAKGNTQIIYSTHSHYMVNPLWLEKAYIVENRATDYDNVDEVDSFAIRATDVNAIRYKTFVGSHPTKTTYFQPVLDALEVTFSPLVASSHALIVEGKFDFYPIAFFRRKTSSLIPQIFPGNGAGSLGSLISIFRGWGVSFRIILDGDKAGVEGKAAYMANYLLSEREIVTLGDLSPELKGKSFESIYKSDVRSAVQYRYGITKVGKRELALFFQELLSSDDKTFFEQTELAFSPISNWMNTEFGVT